MRVVGPDNCLGLWSPRLEQMAERLEHMRVAQIPGFGAAVIHDAVISLGRRDQARVLRRVKEALAVPVPVFELFRQQLPALLHNDLLAFAVTGGEHGTAVSRRLLLPRCQAAITLA